MKNRFFGEKGSLAVRTAAILALLAAVVLTATMCGPAQPGDETSGTRDAATLAIEHFSIIEGTTWSGAQDRAGKRIAEKYPNVTYVYREEVGPDLAVPYAEEMIADGARMCISSRSLPAI
jgi:hypothetical protein